MAQKKNGIGIALPQIHLPVCALPSSYVSASRLSSLLYHGQLCPLGPQKQVIIWLSFPS